MQKYFPFELIKLNGIESLKNEIYHQITFFFKYTVHIWNGHIVYIADRKKERGRKREKGREREGE